MPPISRYVSAARGTANSLRRLARTSARKPFPQIAREMVACYRQEGRFPRQYLLNQLYHRDVSAPEAFVATEAMRGLTEAGARSQARLILDDKLHFHQFYRDSGVPIPRLLGFSLQDRLYVGDEARCVKSGEAFRQVAHDLLALTPRGVFAKPIAGSKGEGVHRLRHDSPEEEVDRVGRAMRHGSYVMEEEVAQHPEVACVFPRCLNTVRIISGALPDGGLRTVSALIRFGMGSAHIDNSSRGGLFAPVDLSTGQVAGPARRFFEHGGGRLANHPDTGVAFEGTTIPYFHEAVALTERALRMLPAPVVGWDVGITPHGPVLIEGNGYPHLVGAELAAGGYRGNAAFHDLARAYPGR